jgi:DNA-binding transcriptional ArsR family regulator
LKDSFAKDSFAKDSFAKDILSILSDDTSLKIIEALEGKELSIQQISSHLDIPLSSTYRKMGKLEQLRIVKKAKIIRNLDGMDESLYTRWADEINISYKDKSFSITIKMKPIEERIVRLWQKFKG